VRSTQRRSGQRPRPAKATSSTRTSGSHAGGVGGKGRQVAMEQIPDGDLDRLGGLPTSAWRSASVRPHQGRGGSPARRAGRQVQHGAVRAASRGQRGGRSAGQYRWPERQAVAPEGRRDLGEVGSRPNQHATLPFGSAAQASRTKRQTSAASAASSPFRNACTVTALPPGRARGQAGAVCDGAVRCRPRPGECGRKSRSPAYDPSTER